MERMRQSHRQSIGRSAYAKNSIAPGNARHADPAILERMGLFRTHLASLTDSDYKIVHKAEDFTRDPFYGSLAPWLQS